MLGFDYSGYDRLVSRLLREQHMQLQLSTLWLCFRCLQFHGTDWKYSFCFNFHFFKLNLTFWSNVWYVSAALLGGSRAFWSTNWWPVCTWHDKWQVQVVQVVLLYYYSVSILCLDLWILSWFVLSCRVSVQGQGPGPRYGHVMEVAAQRYIVSTCGNDGEFNLLAF